MEYNPFDSDDEDYGFVSHKFAEKNKTLKSRDEDDDDDDDVEAVKNLQTNPFLIDTICMGRGSSTNSFQDNLAANKNPFLYDDEDEDEDNNKCILNNNKSFQTQRSCGRGILPNYSESNFVTQQKLIEASKNQFMYNDLKKAHGVNDKFVEETEITEVLRSLNIYSCNKSQLNSKKTLRVPNVTHNVNLNRKVPLITDEEYFKFEADLPRVNETFNKEYLEAKYKYSSESALSSSSSSASSSYLPSSSSSTSSSEITTKEVYMIKRNNKRGRPILSTSSHFKL